MKVFSLCVLSVIIISFACSMAPEGEIRPSIGPRTVDVDINSYQTIYYVVNNTGSDESGDGSRDRPWRTIQHALRNTMEASAGHRYAVLVSSGDYAQETILMKPHVDLYGGFDPVTWERDVSASASVLSGDQERRIVVAADDARLDGFVLMNGRIRGKGAAIYGAGVSPTITNNVFRNNRTLGPRPWRPKFLHEISNDGGAVYFEKGSRPIVENNLFAGNKTENGRGAAMALHSRCGGRIANHVFLGNVAGLDDPMRSSDGGAVSIFDWSDPVVENNVFLNNESLASNDAGGMFVALWSSPVIRKNVFVGNVCGDDAGALFVGGQEHRYDAPLDPLPPEDEFFVTVEENLFIGNANPSRNSGVMRMTMESRGVFRKNVTAHNTGVYFQRSDVLIEDNLILDNFLLVEAKEGLEPCVVGNNVIWGDYTQTVEATVTDNAMKDACPGNHQKPPLIFDDGRILTPDAVFPTKLGVTTKLYFSNGTFEESALVNRVVRAGDRWGVIKSNDAHHVDIWGDFSREILFFLLPSYRRC